MRASKGPKSQTKRGIVGFVTLVSLFLILGLLRRNIRLSVTRDLFISSLPLTTTENLQSRQRWALHMQFPFASDAIGPPVPTTYSLQKGSAHATVMGMATNYDVSVYRRFVGSLRKSGFKGNIILVVSPVPQPGVEEYLISQNVTMKKLTIVNCTTDIMEDEDKSKLNSEGVEIMTCAHPYPDLKVRWGRFGLLRDYLEECQVCTGPVLISDVRDTFFQRDPFGADAPPVAGLQVFQEHRTMRTTHWLVQVPVERCKNITIFDEPMLCSGTTIGTRDAMLQYLKDMVTEMRVWMRDEKCCCNKMNGDDQSIHNYLYYSGKLPYATPQLNRVGLVNTVGSQGSMIFQAKQKQKVEAGMDPGRAADIPYTSYEEEEKGDWLGLQYDLTDPQGYFIDFNGDRSFIVHQLDRFGNPLWRWLDGKGGMRLQES